MIISAERVNTVKFIKLKSGKIVRQVEEQYLRNDIPCGLSNCPLCDKNESNNLFYKSIDCNLSLEFKSSHLMKRDEEMKGDDESEAATQIADKIYIVDHSFALNQFDFIENC